LHLIRILYLYLLLMEKNVSRVALKLNQPQPSISASLCKLSELTGDPLLVRGARGSVPGAPSSAAQRGRGLALFRLDFVHADAARPGLDGQFLRFYKKTLALKSFTTPVTFPPMRFYQLWHEQVHHAPEHKWLRDLISVRQRAGQQIRSSPQGRLLPVEQH
jgi:DNA-binding transcriptional LysR family regulator